MDVTRLFSGYSSERGSSYSRARRTVVLVCSSKARFLQSFRVDAIVHTIEQSLDLEVI